MRKRNNTEEGLIFIGAALAILVITGVSLAGLNLNRMNRLELAKNVEREAAAQSATDAVLGFITSNERLPCPAGERFGVEDCNLTKGWLPLSTLLGFAADKNSWKLLPIRYMVYRGDRTPQDPDLTTLTDIYSPGSASGAPAYHSPQIINTLDLCTALRNLSPNQNSDLPWMASDSENRTGKRQDRAFYRRSGDIVNVAFGVAVADPYASSKMSGVNSDLSKPQMESPDRSISTEYTDLVRVIEAPLLHERLSCPSLISALDTAAVAAAWSHGAQKGKEATVEALGKVVEIEGIAVAAQGTGAMTATGNLLNLWAALIQGALKAAFGPTPADFAGGAEAVSKFPGSFALTLLEVTHEMMSMGVEVMNLTGYKVIQNKANGKEIWNSSDEHLKNMDQASSMR